MLGKSIVIKAENVSKQYRLGDIGTGSLKDDLKRFSYRLMGKEDPFLALSEENDRTTLTSSGYVWALKNVSFEVGHGDIIGLIGKNGAGKSTLLKILSRITGPTTGTVKMKGRIASLLEVGTGFHGDLSGRENIFLNGAILGMRKHEIARKFDEIVAFSGVERYIDTPVKRYSSGMYVRLAFAVAAHLESEILIVDEVLAVGDAEFQKKCLGKMGEVSKGEGRTVLFVSHNMTAVESLCNKGIYLKNGTVNFEGTAKAAILEYLKNESTIKRSNFQYSSVDEALGNNNVKLIAAAVANAQAPDEVIDVSSPIQIAFTLVNLTQDPALSVGFDLMNIKGDILFGSGSKGNYPSGEPVTTVCNIPANFLNDGAYSISFYVHSQHMAELYYNTDLLDFEVKDVARESGYLGKINGVIRTNFKWETSV